MNRVDAIYARQSIDKADSISIESQIEFCRYETRGNAHRVYADKGYSGKNTDRPQFQNMLSAIRNGEIKRVICYKLDRCSRSILDFTALMEEFQKYHVEFISCTEKFDTATPMGRAMLNICIVFAQLERETIQQRVFDAYHARSKLGFYMGGRVPFGFRLEAFALNGKKTSRYAVHKEEAEILRYMYAVYADANASLGDVVRALDRAGIHHPRKADGKWTRTYIGRMLYNPCYVKADLAVYEFFRDLDVTIHNDPQDFAGTNGCYIHTQKNAAYSEEHLILAPHEGIVPSDIWLACRNKQARTGRSDHHNKRIHTWLAGKLKCGKCGYAAVAARTVKSNGRIFRYIVCSDPHVGTARCPGLHGLKADQVEAIVSQSIRVKLKTLSHSPVHAPETADETVQNLKLQIAQLTSQIDKATSNAMEATGPLIACLSEKVQCLDKKRKACSAMLEARYKQLRAEHSDTGYDTDYASCWDQLTPQDRNSVMAVLISNITLTDGEITIHWRI